MGRSAPQASAPERDVGASSSSSSSSSSVPSSSSSSSSKLALFERIDQFDKELSLSVHGGGLAVPRWILKSLEYSGDGLWSIPLIAALWLAPILLDKADLRNFLFNLFVAFIFDLALIGLMKGLIRRPRPVYNKSMFLVLSVDHYSFPSGHSSRAIMVATLCWFYLPLWKSLLASRTPFWEDKLQYAKFEVKEYLPAFEICLAIAISSWALATATSRVLLGRHYVLDVLVGSLIGVLEALFVHLVLFVPEDLSQGIHNSVHGVFKQA